MGWRFGILRVPLKQPFHKGIPGIQTTNLSLGDQRGWIKVVSRSFTSVESKKKHKKNTHQSKGWPKWLNGLYSIHTTSKPLFFIDIITSILNQPSYPLEASPDGCDYHEEDDEDDAYTDDSAVQM